MNDFLRSIINFCFFKIIFFHFIYNEGNFSLEEENIIENIKKIFRLKKRTKLHCNWRYGGKQTKAIKERIFRDIKTRFEYKEEETYYKPVRVSNFWSNSYIWFESNSDRNKTLSVEECLNKTRSFLKDIINMKFHQYEITLFLP